MLVCSWVRIGCYLGDGEVGDFQEGEQSPGSHGHGGGSLFILVDVVAFRVFSKAAV